jgi:hypothetical protein
MKAMLYPKMFSAENGRFRVQVRGNNIQVFATPPDSHTDLKQKIDIRDRSDLENLSVAILAVIEAYKSDEQPE